MNTKREILNLLEQNKGSFISGEKLANSLALSRTAIWKAIKTLRGEGYNILSESGKGYSLAKNSDLLSPEGISSYLDIDIPIFTYEEIDSTNIMASKMANQGAAHGTLVVSSHQTHGRGRLGRKFYSPKDTGIYMSLVVRPTCKMEELVLVTIAAAVATSKAIQKITEKKTEIKWVNDIFVEEKKVVGILTEAITNVENGQITALVVGIGINCWTEDFPEDAGQAGSILETFSKNQLIASVASNFLELVDNLRDKNLIDYYRKHSMILGKKINVHRAGENNVEVATALDIKPNGGLEVIFEDKRREILSSGEISIRLTNTKGANIEK